MCACIYVCMGVMHVCGMWLGMCVHVMRVCARVYGICEGWVGGNMAWGGA